MTKKNKKAQMLQLGYVIVIVLGLIILLLGFTYFSTSVECSALKTDCEESQYCGADFVCHDFPTLTKTSVQEETTTNYRTLGGVTIATLSLIISLFIIKRKS